MIESGVCMRRAAWLCPVGGEPMEELFGAVGPLRNGAAHPAAGQWLCGGSALVGTGGTVGRVDGVGFVGAVVGANKRTERNLFRVGVGLFDFVWGLADRVRGRELEGGYGVVVGGSAFAGGTFEGRLRLIGPFDAGRGGGDEGHQGEKGQGRPQHSTHVIE